MPGVSQSTDLERLVSNENIAIKCKAEFSALKEGCICLQMLPICMVTFVKIKETSCYWLPLRARPYHCHTKATWQIPQRGRACLQAAHDCQFCIQSSVVPWVLHLASSSPATKKYFGRARTIVYPQQFVFAESCCSRCVDMLRNVC